MIPLLLEALLDFHQKCVHSGPLNLVDGLPIDPGGPVVGPHSPPCFPQNDPLKEPIIKSVELPPSVALGRPV
jgi:hypothetical protein